MRDKYAAGTTVSVSKSRDEIERILERFGASGQIWMRDDDQRQVTIAFKRGDKSYRFDVPLPDWQEEEYLLTPSRGWERTEKQAKEAAEAESRRRFRSLANYIKALLDAIDTGIIQAEQALLPYMVVPGGATVWQALKPQIDQMLESGEMPSLRRALSAG